MRKNPGGRTHEDLDRDTTGGEFGEPLGGEIWITPVTKRRIRVTAIAAIAAASFREVFMKGSSFPQFVLGT